MSSIQQIGGWAILKAIGSSHWRALYAKNGESLLSGFVKEG